MEGQKVPGRTLAGPGGVGPHQICPAGWACIWGKHWWACIKMKYFWSNGKWRLNWHIFPFLSITTSEIQNAPDKMWNCVEGELGQYLTSHDMKDHIGALVTTHGLLTTFPISPKISPPMDQSLLKSILMLAHCHSTVGSTNPQNVPFSPPGDRFKIWYGDRSNLPTLLWCLQCLGLSLTGVAQCLLLLSRWTLLGYASLPSNPIESVQSLCSATFTFTSSSSSVLQTSNHKSHNVLLCNRSRTQSVLLYVLLLLWRGKFWSHLGSGLDRISTLEKLWRQSQASSIM